MAQGVRGKPKSAIFLGHSMPLGQGFAALAAGLADQVAPVDATNCGIHRGIEDAVVATFDYVPDRHDEHEFVRVEQGTVCDPGRHRIGQLGRAIFPDMSLDISHANAGRPPVSLAVHRVCPWFSDADASLRRSAPEPGKHPRAAAKLVLPDFIEVPRYHRLSVILDQAYGDVWIRESNIASHPDVHIPGGNQCVLGVFGKDASRLRLPSQPLA